MTLPNRNVRVLVPLSLPSTIHATSQSCVSDSLNVNASPGPPVSSSESFDANYFLNNIFSPKTEVALANQFVRHKRQAAEAESLAAERAQQAKHQQQQLDQQAVQQRLIKMKEEEEDKKVLVSRIV